MKRSFFLLTMLFFGCSLFAQWPSSPDENKRLTEPSFLTGEVRTLPDGSFYLFLDRAENTYDTIVPFLYYFDKNGNPVWEEPIALTRQPTLTWTKCMSHLLVDRDGNAVVGVQNTKLQMGDIESYTAFKISKEGEFLWGKDGVDLHGGGIPAGESNAFLQLAQLTDGSYIFSWMADEITLQKVSPDGKVLWGEGKKVGSGAWPFVFDAGDNEFILFYQASGLIARKLDFDGNDIWEQPTLVFSGELNSTIPAWTYLKAIPADGGLVAGWYGYEGDEHFSQCAYIKPDGSHAFPDGDKGLRLHYNNYWGYSPELVFDKDEKAIYAAWNEAVPGRNYAQHASAQKVSLEGELLWNPEGVELEPLPEDGGGVAYVSAAAGPKGTGLFGFMKQTGLAANEDVLVKAVLVSSDGKYAWEDTSRLISNAESVKYSLLSTGYVNDQWLLIWEDCRDWGKGSVQDRNFWSQNIRLDGSMGDAVGNEIPQSLEGSFQVYPNPATDVVYMRYDNPLPETLKVRVSLVNLKGGVEGVVYEGCLYPGVNNMRAERIPGLESGVYMLRMETPQGVLNTKVVYL